MSRQQCPVELRSNRDTSSKDSLGRTWLGRLTAAVTNHIIQMHLPPVFHLVTAWALLWAPKGTNRERTLIILLDYPTNGSKQKPWTTFTRLSRRAQSLLTLRNCLITRIATHLSTLSHATLTQGCSLKCTKLTTISSSVSQNKKVAKGARNGLTQIHSLEQAVEEEGVPRVVLAGKRRKVVVGLEEQVDSHLPEVWCMERLEVCKRTSP